ncbi:hypothetical protein ACQ4M3_00480 [Leptolyngbya sp. AN03gr2]|uniref:hypothetical protein n=1 Tax=unclassified Leptolyngbya TaxID=2650499 RepID=UPI003D31258F
MKIPIRDQLKGLIKARSLDTQVWFLESIDWVKQPECPAILIGTQHQLISGLLNRSTTVDRELYPIVAGLLANDSFIACLNTSLYGWGEKCLPKSKD